MPQEFINKFYVYKIINMINKKIYIGKSNNVKKRWREHISYSNNKSHNYPISNAIRKYGKNNFSIEIVGEFLCEQKAYDIEIECIYYYNSMDKNIGYNICPGGQGAGSGAANHFYGKSFTQEHKNKISSSLNKYYASNAAPQKGYRHTDAAKLAISEAVSGIKRSLDFKENLRKHKQKITLSQANEIRSLYASGHYTTRQLGTMFGISGTSVKNILSNKTYKEEP
jgi:group I intron endonuclease